MRGSGSVVQQMNIKIANRLYLSGVPGGLSDALKARLTIENPKYIENERQGRWQGDTPEVLRFYSESPGRLAAPRGFIRQLINISRRLRVNFTIDNRRRALPEVDFTFQGSLKPFQGEAVDAMLKKDFGTLSAATGSGKTVMALDMIAQRRQPALVVVHTRELQAQWIDRIETFLGIPADEVGVIGSGTKRAGEKITVSLVQSLYKCAGEVSPNVGHLIIDECHRTPSRTFTEAVTAFDCRYMLGLSATPWRRDKLSKLIFWHIGDVIHEVDKSRLIENGHILQAEVITRETDFEPFFCPTNEYTKMLSELTKDPDRNRLICADVEREACNGGGVCLVLSDRKAHCEALSELLDVYHGINSEVLTGNISAKKRADIVERLNEGGVRVLIATGQLVGEGFDCRGLETLFLTTPIKFSGRVIQYLGRVLRPAEGKAGAKVYDYVDNRVGVLRASARARQRVFRPGVGGPGQGARSAVGV